MKRTVKKVNKTVAIIMLSALLLSGCASDAGESETGQSDAGSISTAAIPGMQKVEAQDRTEKEAVLEESMENGTVTVKYDVQAKLDETEAQVAELEKKLTGDVSISQADMNDLSYEIYLTWDDTLNELWQVLKETLDETTMDDLLQEQRSWITEKENAVQQVAEEMGGGSITPVVCNHTATELTKERVYELAAYLGGVDNSSGSSVTLTLYVEGMEEKVPATLFEGRLYTLYVPKEGWEMYASEAWRSEVNPAAQFWVTDYAGTDADIVCQQLSKAAGYEPTEDDKYLLRYEDENSVIWNVKLFTQEDETVGIFYCYPAEAEEGFGTRLSAIVNTFAWKKE